MLSVRGLTVTYGRHPALQDVSIEVAAGEIVVILGANGAGKSSLLRAVAGICEGSVSGEIVLDGKALREMSCDRIVEQGVALVPEGRGIFGELTVQENLVLGAYTRRARHAESENLSRVYGLFPKLQERRSQVVRTMSGGEQQMVAVGRAMMSAPQILMLDEPSLGLSPLLCKELFRCLREIRRTGTGILLVEQNARQSLAIAHRGYLLENSRIIFEDSADRLARDPAVQTAYLGVNKASPSRSDEADGAESVEGPPPVSAGIRARPQPRRTASEQIGLDIDELVGRVRVHRAPSRLPSVSAGAAWHRDPGLGDLVQSIERAAANARKRGAGLQRPDRDGKADGPGSRTVPDKPVPVIEIYRRPRIEVYRRGEGGKMKHEQESKDA